MTIQRFDRVPCPVCGREVCVTSVTKRGFKVTEHRTKPPRGRWCASAERASMTSDGGCERMTTFDPAHDYLSDEGLLAAEALVAHIPQDFTMDVDATPKTVTMRLRFKQSLSAFERADSAEPLIHAAMLLDTLCKNLRHERETHAVVTDGSADAPGVAS